MLETHYFDILVGPKGFVEVSLSRQLMGDHILPLDLRVYAPHTGVGFRKLSTAKILLKSCLILDAF